jgi:Txe/YoeB family toxin of Txe-Axe toxin-antitoxin module
MTYIKINKVYFVNEKIKKMYAGLGNGRSEEKELYSLINRALDDLEENPVRFVSIPKKQWPKEYILKYNINNLWKYDLPNGWRIIYTIKGNNIEIISVVLEWITHKDYERKFGYKRS